MPPLLEAILTPVVIFAAFFFLGWLLARDKISRTGRILGWLSVAVTLISVAWSFWFETFAPYVRKGRVLSALLSVAQLVAAIVGLALAFYGAVRFLRAWFGMGWDLSSIQNFLENSPPFERIRKESDAGARWKLSGELVLRALLLPGLGLMLLGIGMVILGFQFLEPDRSLAIDTASVYTGLVSSGLGLVQIAARALVVHVGKD